MRDWRHEATFGLTVACRRWKHLGNELTCKWTFLPMGNGSQDLPSLAGFGNDDLATQRRIIWFERRWARRTCWLNKRVFLEAWA